MNPEPTRVPVTILGETYTILGDASPEYILRLADLVEIRMEELSRAFPHLNRSKLAVLCAMNLADELTQWKRAAETVPAGNIPPEMEAVFEEKTKKLISLLEDGMIGDIY